MSVYLRLAVLLVVAMPLQWWWATRFAPWGFAPQVLLVLTAAVAARRGAVAAMTLGFVWGLFLDVLSPRLFGANAFAMTLIGYGTGSVRRQLDVAGLAPQCLVVFFMTLAYFLLFGALGLVFTKSFLWVGWSVFLLTPLYNAFVCAVVYVTGAVAWAGERQYYP